MAQEKISFGIDLNPKEQVEESRKIAMELIKKDSIIWRQKGDQHRSYFFKEANEELPYRICVPTNWDGISELPMLVFLHGGWNDENSYLDQNDKQLVRLADEYGFLLVSPLGCHGAYGNNLHLPAVFGEKEISAKIIKNGHNDAHSIQQQVASEKDVINVIELVLAEYPVDRDAMFLAGHSMGAGGTWYLGAKYHEYWAALAPLSGPFVLEDGYPWENLRNIPVFITEGTKAVGKASRLIYQYMSERELPVMFMEVNEGHGEMIPVVLPHVFMFLDDVRAKSKQISK
ncbi:MAG: hypothetical protein HUJ96_02230 [Marinilabiliaceae bacterium]|nr:hypothetical protein [Marinilabiliaceae bacterium]